MLQTAASVYLVKRPYKGGWRWIGQAKYKDAGGVWRTTKRTLTDPDGRPIMTDPDTTDENGEIVKSTRNIRKARQALELWRDSLAGTPMGGRALVADYMRADLRSREGNLQPSTLRRNREYVRIIERGLQGVTMAELTTKRVREWVHDMRDRGLAPATIKTAYSILSTTCDRAVQNGDIPRSPCTREVIAQDLPKVLTMEQADAQKPNALDAEGVRRANGLLDATTNGRLRIGARMALCCGLRASECCGLLWRDVDLDAQTITIRVAIGRAEGGTYAKGAKTTDSYRVIPMPQSLADELRAWRIVQRTQWQAMADGQEKGVAPFADTYVIGYIDGRFMTPHALGNAWVRLARKGDGEGELLGTRGRRVTFHDLRHTFATHAIASGANARAVAALMGHKDASTTLSIYADALPEQSRATMDEVGAILATGSSWQLQPDSGECQGNAQTETPAG